MRSRRLVVALVAVVLSLALADAVSAHANLVAASVGPGGRVGGTVEEIEMIFDEPITELAVEIENPDGTLIDLSIDELGPQQHRIEFDPLVTNGLYILRYDFRSLDDDVVFLAYVFHYLDGEPEPLPLTTAIPDPPVPVWQEPWVIALLVVVAGGVVWQAVRLRRQRRVLRRSLPG